MRKSPTFFIEDITSHSSSNFASTENNELFTRYMINIVEQLLSLSDTGTSLTEAATILNISFNDAHALVERAYKVTKIATTRGQPRFIKPNPLGKPILSPLSVQEQSDYRLLSHLRTNANKPRCHSYNDWHWFISICSEKISVSKAYISFPKPEIVNFKRFVSIAKQLLPEKSWLITSDYELLKSALNESEYKSMQLKNSDSAATLRIGIAGREKREQPSSLGTSKTVWKCSPLLRFFVHIMLITDESLTIPEEHI